MLIIQIIYNGKLWDRIPSLIFVFNGVKQRVLLFSIFGVQINQQCCWMLFVGLVLNPIPIELKKPRLGTKRYVITPRPFPNHSPTSTRKRVSTQFKLKFLKGLGTHFSCSSTLHFCCGTRACTTEEPPPPRCTRPFSCSAVKLQHVDSFGYEPAFLQLLSAPNAASSS